MTVVVVFAVWVAFGVAFGILLGGMVGLDQDGPLAVLGSDVVDEAEAILRGES